MKNIVFLFIAISIFKSVSSQSDSIFILKANVDFVSRYVWRGSDYFNSSCIQPDMQINYKEKIGLGIWGSTSFFSYMPIWHFSNEPIQEIDWYFFVNIKRFNLYIYDYFFFNSYKNLSYFDFKEKTTGHTLSLDLSYTFSEKYPLTILASYNFWGNDQLRSTYVEMAYEFKEKQVLLFIGGTLYEGWYASKTGVCNTGVQLIKDIKVSSSLNIPLKIQCVVNPIKENIYFVAAISL